VDSGNYDWTAFAAGFLIAVLIIILIRWRRSQRRPDDLRAPPRIPPTAANLSPDLRAQIRQLKGDGRVIEAIKLAREQTGLGLKEAKDLVDGIV
jgi:hypothetical protein